MFFSFIQGTGRIDDLYRVVHNYLEVVNCRRLKRAVNATRLRQSRKARPYCSEICEKFNACNVIAPRLAPRALCKAGRLSTFISIAVIWLYLVRNWWAIFYTNNTWVNRRWKVNLLRCTRVFCQSESVSVWASRLSIVVFSYYTLPSTIKYHIKFRFWKKNKEKI